MFLMLVSGIEFGVTLVVIIGKGGSVSKSLPEMLPQCGVFLLITNCMLILDVEDVNKQSLSTRQVCAVSSTNISGGLAASDGRSMTASVEEAGRWDLLVFGQLVQRWLRDIPFSVQSF